MQNVPFRSNEQIWLEVDRFRLVKGGSALIGPPADTVALAEVVFRLNAIRFSRLFSRFKMDAAITPDLKDIYIDSEAYDGFEAGKPWMTNRLRFSVAHELGHYFMHSKEIQSNRFQTLVQFKSWMGDRSKPNTPEYQADEFAGRLLVPREPFIYWYDRYSKAASQKDPEWYRLANARSVLAKLIAPRFGVHYRAIETRFDHEGLWPA